jgi:hypothetical protein
MKNLRRDDDRVRKREQQNCATLRYTGEGCPPARRKISCTEPVIIYSKFVRYKDVRNETTVSFIILTRTVFDLATTNEVTDFLLYGWPRHRYLCEPPTIVHGMYPVYPFFRMYGLRNNLAEPVKEIIR